MKKANSKLLLDASTTYLYTSSLLAKVCGHAASAFLQYIHYNSDQATHLHNGKLYWYHTYEQIHAELKCFSIPTFKRAVKKLKDMGFLLVEQLDNRPGWKQVNYYRINYEKVTEFVNAQTPTEQKKSQVAKKVKVAFDHVIEIEKKPFVAKPIAPKVKIESPQISMTGTSEPTINVTPEQINAFTFEMKHFFKSLRQQHVDISATDPRLPLLFEHEKQLKRHISYYRGKSSTPYGWHTPEQLQLEKLIGE